MIEVKVPGQNTVIKFPEDMSQDDIRNIMIQQGYGGEDRRGNIPPVDSAPAPMGDPAAGSLDMFMAPGVPSEIGKGMVANAPAIGGAIGGSIGMLAPPISPLTAGLGMAAGGLVQRGLEGTQGTERQESKEMLTDFGVGLGSEVAGYGAGWLAQKLFAPAMGKYRRPPGPSLILPKARGCPTLSQPGKG